MQSRLLLLSCLLVPMASLAQDEDETREKAAMLAGTRATLAAYDVIVVPRADIPVSVHIKLGETTSKYKDVIYDGIRITAPDNVAERDFVWYFNAPQSWSSWFIVPLKGDFDGGFRGRLKADRVYSELDKPQEKERVRMMQTLEGGFFKPGEEYILGVRQMNQENASPGDLRAVFRFVAKPEEKKKWDNESIERVLKLHEAPASDQVAELDSRGGRILLDPEFFNPEEASSRIATMLSCIRRKMSYRDGASVNLEVPCESGHSHPGLARIRAKYGVADFVRPAAEVRKLNQSAKGNQAASLLAEVTTHYYDYFAFEVADSDPDEIIIGMRVRTQPNDFEQGPPLAVGASFRRSAGQRLTVLYQDGREVGRYYHFMEGGVEPVCIQEPPAGKYTSDRMTLEYQGGGNWMLVTEVNGRVIRRLPFAKDRINGVGEGFYSDGTPKFKGGFKEGQLHGEVIEYVEDGTVSRRRWFNEGVPVQDDGKNTPREGTAKALEPKTKAEPQR